MDYRDRVLARAASWVGRDFRRGEPAQCATFVRQVFADAGFTLPVADPPDDLKLIPGYPVGPSYADSFAGDNVGRLIPVSDRQPADIIMYQNTYDNYPEGTITHVGIYAGDNEIIHRPTSDRPVCRSAYDYARIAEIRRPYLGFTLAVNVCRGRVVSAVSNGRLINDPSFKVFIKPDRVSLAYGGEIYTDPDVLRFAAWVKIENKWPGGFYTYKGRAWKFGNVEPEESNWLQVVVSTEAGECALYIDSVPYHKPDVSLIAADGG